MLKVLPVVFVLASVGWALNVKEPHWPTNICATLKAELTEGPLGHIPESSESRLDTARIQHALNKCGAGRALKLVKGTGNAFLTGHLELPSGVTLWIDAGVTLFASRNPRDFDRTSHSCGVVSTHFGGCLPLISATNTRNSGIVGLGTIDGRGGQKVIGSGATWWQMATEAGNSRYQNNPRLVVIHNSQHFTLYKVRLHNSPEYHFVTQNVDGLTVWGVTVDTPSKAYPSGTHARNTDAFDPNGKNMVFSDLYVNAGDDHIAIKGSAPVANVLVQNSHFYKGHGMSIGSETYGGVVNVTVRNLSIDGADIGLRIKSDSSRGGTVQGVRYENICIRHTREPLVFNAYYSTNQGHRYPNFHDIHVTNTHIVGGGRKQLIFKGYNKNNPLKINLDNVVSDSKESVSASNAQITLGPGQVVNIPVSSNAGHNVHVNGHGGKSKTFDCSHMFVPMPRS